MVKASPQGLARLGEGRVAHLATADAEGQPHVVPVCFVSREGYIYIAIDQKPKRVGPKGLKRVRNIIENPRVALVVDHYEEDWGRLWQVMVRGRAEVLEEGVEHGEAVLRLREKYPQYRDMAMEGRPVIKMTIERTVEWKGAQDKG
ncbi:MAG: TIGR03668 family PPOX class F420-dependent oxidoreductase [SAR202 cluster bacterium]|nr:TIGR03668 family PPOX class F420-dependent oxidoreductase [SAR202 cluster bacterium]